MGQAWSERVLMTDASEEGGAVIECQAPLEQVREEARWAPRGGWTLFTGDQAELDRRRHGALVDPDAAIVLAGEPSPEGPEGGASTPGSPAAGS
eukprot:7534348-Lingulodinium_polyedra.AAC.1